MSLAILFHFLCAQHVSDINISIDRSLRLCWSMDILMSETCWAHKKWNKIASDIKLVFHSSTITMMHGPINIGFFFLTFVYSSSLHVSSNQVLIIRRVSCINKTSGICHCMSSLMSRSSVKIFLTVSLSMITCSAVLLTVDDFHAQFDEFLQCFLQFCLLLAVLISLRQWHLLFLQKNVSPICKLLFSS